MYVDMLLEKIVLKQYRPLYRKYRYVDIYNLETNGLYKDVQTGVAEMYNLTKRLLKRP